MCHKSASVLRVCECVTSVLQVCYECVTSVRVCYECASVLQVNGRHHVLHVLHCNQPVFMESQMSVDLFPNTTHDSLLARTMNIYCPRHLVTAAVESAT